MRTLDRKLLRDLWRLRGHVLAIVLVTACGTASFVTMHEAYEAILGARDSFYRDYRFADVFTRLRRAPVSILPTVREIDGIAEVADRITWSVSVEVPDLDQPAMARLVAIPETNKDFLNGVHLRAGRWPEPGRSGEVLVSEAFAVANGLQPGATLPAIINGRWQRLAIVGVGISPEFVNEAFEFTILPDPKRFGILWMQRPALEGVLDMRGAFNDLSATLAPGADSAHVIAELDRLLAPYGGSGAHDRDEQFSHRFLTDEINQDRVTGAVVPAVFLGVAAFLVHNVLLRLIALQRAQIGVLKAFGYSRLEIGSHYTLLALAAVTIGTVVGIGLGSWLGVGLAEMYREFFHFPELVFALSAQTLAVVAMLAIGTALAGALPAVLRAVRLAPAEAMRPAPPAQFRPTLIERLGLQRVIALSARMVLRNIERRPWRSLLSLLALALATALLVIGRYSIDAVDEVISVQFRQAMRDDIAVFLTEPRGEIARFDLAAVDGVAQVEPFRFVPVRLRSGHRSRRVAIQAQPVGAELRRILDRDRKAVPIPADGIVLSTKLADILHVAAGDEVTVEVLEGRRLVRDVTVAGLADEYIGLQSYMSLASVSRLLGEAPTISGAFLRIDPAEPKDLFRRFRDMPAVAVLGIREAVLASFSDTIARNMMVMTTVLVGFAAVIAAGMVYNGARIALSEHAVELATLRVLGFTQAETGLLVLGEQALLIAAAIPVGAALGYGVSGWLAHLLSGEVYRLPLVISGKTYLFATAVVCIAAIASGALTLLQLRRFDLVEALKSRE